MSVPQGAADATAEPATRRGERPAGGRAGWSWGRGRGSEEGGEQGGWELPPLHGSPWRWAGWAPGWAGCRVAWGTTTTLGWLMWGCRDAGRWWISSKVEEAVLNNKMMRLLQPPCSPFPCALSGLWMWGHPARVRRAPLPGIGGWTSPLFFFLGRGRGVLAWSSPAWPHHHLGCCCSNTDASAGLGCVSTALGDFPPLSAWCYGEIMP